MQSVSNEKSVKHSYWISEIGQRTAWLIGKPALSFFMHFRVFGMENLKGLKNGYILASNHTSELDPLLILSSFELSSKRLAVYFVSAPRDFYRDNMLQTVFYTQALFRFVGAYPAIFGAKNFEKSLDTHIKLVRNGRNVAIFPEGRIPKDGSLRGVKGGVIALAEATGAPIIPVAISGASHMKFRDFLFQKRRASVTFGRPIHLKELFEGYDHPTPKDFKKIATKKVMGEVGKLLHQRATEL